MGDRCFNRLTLSRKRRRGWQPSPAEFEVGRFRSGGSTYPMPVVSRSVDLVPNLVCYSFTRPAGEVLLQNPPLRVGLKD